MKKFSPLSNNKKRNAVGILHCFIYLVVLVLSACEPHTHSTNEKPVIGVSIAPLYSLVKSVVGSKAEVILIIPPNEDPHHFSFKPSQIKDISRADLIFYLEEPALNKALSENIEGTVVNLLNDASILTLNARKFPALHQDHDTHHDHGAHATEKSSKASNKASKKISAQKMEHSKHNTHTQHSVHLPKQVEGESEAHYQVGVVDPHIWLDPLNVVRIMNTVTALLVEHDPVHKKTYQSNSKQLKKRLIALHDSLEAKLKPYQGQRYISDHDSFHYFETRYRLKAAALLSTQHGHAIRGKQIKIQRDIIRNQKVSCMLLTELTQPNLINALSEGLTVNPVVADPLGKNLPLGTSLYFEMMTILGSQVANCLKTQATAVPTVESHDSKHTHH